MQNTPFSAQKIQSILSHWDIDTTVHTSPHQGLINQTFLIGQPLEGVLQWVNPIFDARIHTDIAALTRHLKRKGMVSTELLPTKNGALYINHQKNGLEDNDNEHAGYWRILRFIKGLTFDQIPSSALAFEAGKLVGSFHQALADFDHIWQAPFRDSHNTTARMNSLSKALNEHSSHPLYDEAYQLGSQILRDWEQWSGSLDLPVRVCHGDLKISNLHFNQDGTGCCLLDLDTIGPGDYSIEIAAAVGGSYSYPAGNGAMMSGAFTLTAGDELTVVVGQQGGVGGQGGGGGGGTFVVLNQVTPLIVAGGGGGSHYNQGSDTAKGGGTGTTGPTASSTGSGYRSGSGGGWAASVVAVLCWPRAASRNCWSVGPVDVVSFSKGNN